MNSVPGPSASPTACPKMVPSQRSIAAFVIGQIIVLQIQPPSSSDGNGRRGHGYPRSNHPLRG
jgi:hypothetical protein